MWLCVQIREGILNRFKSYRVLWFVILLVFSKPTHAEANISNEGFILLGLGAGLIFSIPHEYGITQFEDEWKYKYGWDFQADLTPDQPAKQKLVFQLERIYNEQFRAYVGYRFSRDWYFGGVHHNIKIKSLRPELGVRKCLEGNWACLNLKVQSDFYYNDFWSPNMNISAFWSVF